MEDAFFSVILNRRSVRKYEEKPVPNRLLEDILRAAALAPSAHNTQPWHFVVILETHLRKILAKAMANRYVRDMTAKNVSRVSINRKTKRSIEIFSRAPVLVIACLTEERLKPAKGPHACNERVMAIQSVALACGQLMLAASATGLASCWFSAPLFCMKEIMNILNLKRSWKPQAIITLGYPAEEPSPKERLSLEQIRSYFG
jgi:F420 biosynthesis protein FbiB-like protein